MSKPDQLSLRKTVLKGCYVVAVVYLGFLTFPVSGPLYCYTVLAFWYVVFLDVGWWRLLVAACLFIVSLPFHAFGCQTFPGYHHSLSKQHLKSVGLALHNYHDQNRTFPPAFVSNSEGQPIHSWRSLILPHLEDATRYHGESSRTMVYSFDDSWKSEVNASLREQAPEVYTCPGIRGDPPGNTHFFAVVGPKTAWAGDNSRAMKDFQIGSTRTVVAIETNSIQANWLEPRDLSFDEAVAVLSKPDEHGVWYRSSFGYDHFLDRHILFADGVVRRVGLMTPDDATRLLNGDLDIDSYPLPIKEIHVTRLRPWERLKGYLFAVVAILPAVAWWRTFSRQRLQKPDTAQVSDALRGHQ